MNITELVERAQDEGIDLSPRMVNYYTQLRLIPKPSKKGLGRGKGVLVDYQEETLECIRNIHYLADYCIPINRMGVEGSNWVSKVASYLRALEEDR